jgi:hypothetical protein
MLPDQGKGHTSPKIAENPREIAHRAENTNLLSPNWRPGDRNEPPSWN